MVEEQISGGVTIWYGEENWNLPERDYVDLIHHMSRYPSSPFVLFSSRVGLARVALISVVLGTIWGIHLILLLLTTSSVVFGWSIYVSLLVLYHLCEFFITAKNHPGGANTDSFLINQSFAYGIALLASWVEFWFEAYFCVEFKTGLLHKLSFWGLVLCLGGQSMRTLAMIQAGPSFTHLIAHHRQPHHVLVTQGVYRIFRHPAYFGWFYWSVGTQLILANPICLVGYSIVSWKFFQNRLEEEEEHLLMMFGEEYAEYKRKTWIGIPGLN